jgi:hypothetical protein
MENVRKVDVTLLRTLFDIRQEGTPTIALMVDRYLSESDNLQSRMFDIFGESDSDDLVFPYPLDDNDRPTFDIISEFITGYGFPSGWSDEKMTDEINRFMDMV